MGGGGPRYEAAAELPDPESLLLDVRKERVDEVVSLRTRNLTVVLDRLEDTFNMAAVLRTCEGMGLQEVHVIENPAERFVPNKSVTQGCDKWLDIHKYKDFASCRRALHQRGYAIWASALGEGSRSLYELEFGAKVALVFGNERFGVSQEVLAGSDGRFWLPMRGFTRSFNISVAVAASLSRAVGWRVEHLGPSGDLEGEDAAAVKKRFYALSVKQRKRLFK